MSEPEAVPVVEKARKVAVGALGLLLVVGALGIVAVALQGDVKFVPVRR